jgi:hypothetical protein
MAETYVKALIQGLLSRKEVRFHENAPSGARYRIEIHCDRILMGFDRFFWIAGPVTTPHIYVLTLEVDASAISIEEFSGHLRYL